MRTNPDSVEESATAAAPGDTVTSDASAATSRRRRWRRRLLIAALVAVFLLVAGAHAARQTDLAADHAREGKEALLEVEAALRAMDHPAASAAAARAHEAFEAMESELEAMGPLRPIARAVPLLRVQVRAVDAVADAGSLLSVGAVDLVDASAALLDPTEPDLTVAQGLRGLEDVRRSLAAAMGPLQEATAEIEALRDRRLFGPLDDVRDELLQRLPEALESAEAAEEGVEALLVFAGAEGPRRYLILSQNPDEARPTGGFIGTYGILETDGQELSLERYEGIEKWPALTTAVVPAAEAPAVFRLPEDDRDQQLANVNTSASWREAAMLATRLWELGGEPPVDGVLGLTPETLARLVGVLGPVEVAEYGETVTGDNLIERVDFYTHRAGLPDEVRKEFVAVLAKAVVEKLLDAPATTWADLGRALAASFDARETMVWAADEQIDDAIVERRWDGTLPETDGDFFYAGEFAYANKNGRGLRRVFEHDVDIRTDGSARITTRITTINPYPEVRTGKVNVDAVRYVTVYGAEGATLAEGTDAPIGEERPIAGHPAFAFEATGPPLGQSTFTVVWDAPDVVVETGGELSYELTWMRIPVHAGDVLELDVELPAGWTWAEKAPSGTYPLRNDLHAAWSIDTH